ncbi:hypothetical protein D9M71_714480 [compost metagenome]
MAAICPTAVEFGLSHSPSVISNSIIENGMALLESFSAMVSHAPALERKPLEILMDRGICRRCASHA